VPKTCTPRPSLCADNLTGVLEILEQSFQPTAWLCYRQKNTKSNQGEQEKTRTAIPTLQKSYLHDISCCFSAIAISEQVMHWVYSKRIKTQLHANLRPKSWSAHENKYGHKIWLVHVIKLEYFSFAFWFHAKTMISTEITWSTTLTINALHM